MTRSRGKSRALFSARNAARVVVAGIVVAGTPLALSGTAYAASDDVWDRVAQCESGGRWNINTGNGYAGGLQFTASTWRAHGGQGSPSTASRADQIAVAERVLASQGWGAWPVCSRKVGAKGGPTPRPLPVQQPVPVRLSIPVQRPASEQSGRIEVKPLPVPAAIPAPAAAIPVPAVAVPVPAVRPAPPAAVPAPPPAVAPVAPVVPAAAQPRVVVPAAQTTPLAPKARPSMRYVIAPGAGLSRIATMKPAPGDWKSLQSGSKGTMVNPSTLTTGEEPTRSN